MSGPTFSRDRFESHIGSEFILTDGAKPLNLVLDRLEPGPSPPGQEQYALFFRADGDAPLDQRIYHLDHKAMGGMDLFLVPVGRIGNTLEYQACFNHLVTPRVTERPES